MGWWLFNFITAFRLTNKPQQSGEGNGKPFHLNGELHICLKISLKTFLKARKSTENHGDNLPNKRLWTVYCIYC